MKQTIKITLSLFLLLATLTCLVSCGETDTEKLWASATYSEDVTLGEGAKEVFLDVVLGERFITITLKTDEKTLGEALYAEGIINDASFFDTVNGIKADFAADGTYWAYYSGDEYMNIGVGKTEINGGEHYRLVFTK